MARDHRRLRVFHEAHQLTIAIYKETKDFPRDEWFGIRAQIRRAATSVPSNIVEGSAREGSREYVNFLNIARGSAAEVAYLIELTSELGYLPAQGRDRLKQGYDQLIPQLQSLINSLALPKAQSRKPRAKSPEPRA